MQGFAGAEVPEKRSFVDPNNVRGNPAGKRRSPLKRRSYTSDSTPMKFPEKHASTVLFSDGFRLRISDIPPPENPTQRNWKSAKPGLKCRGPGLKKIHYYGGL